MEIYEANMLRVRDEEGSEYLIESQEHCDLWWKTPENGVPGNYCFYDPVDQSKLDFNSWETQEVFYFTLIEYSFDYGKTWTKYSKAEE